MSENQAGPGSCEPCKKKKCKCDRRMPSCTQCETSRIQCRYSESNKRGIPTGYLGLLEQRLNETEAALFGALSELRGLGSSKPLQRDANPSKMTRMEEWKEYPLQGEGGLERWFQLLGTNQGGFSGQNLPTKPASNQKTQPGLSYEHTLQQVDTSAAADLLQLARSQPAPDLSSFQYSPQAPSQSSPSNFDYSPQTQDHAQFQVADYGGSDEMNSVEDITKEWEPSTGQGAAMDDAALCQSQQLSAEHKYMYY